MFKAILKFASAPVVIAAALLVGTEPGRKLTKKVIKETVKTATVIADSCKELVESGEEQRVKLIGQVKDSTGDIVDKAKDSAGDIMDRVKDSATSIVDRVKDSTAEIVEEARAELKAKKAGGNGGNA
jgi:gas vesicle protein